MTITRTNLEREADPDIWIDIPPANENPALPARIGSLDLIECILKQPETLHQAIREPKRQAALVPKLLGISLVGFLFFGVAMSLVFAASGTWPMLTRIVNWLDDPQLSLIAYSETSSLVSAWMDGSALSLIAAYALGLIAASGICLPSLYFYGLLAGVRMTMMDVVLHTLKSKATAAVALVGILPIYATLALSTIIFELPTYWVRMVFFLGLILPFIAGLWGTRSLYLGLSNLCDTMPAHRRVKRECFLRRLVLSWSAIYTAITPVMIFTLWELFARG
jgi:hypothetical protein